MIRPAPLKAGSEKVTIRALVLAKQTRRQKAGEGQQPVGQLWQEIAMQFDRKWAPRAA